MTFFGSCPRCGVEIPRDRFVNGTAICACGWCDPGPNIKADIKNENKTIRTMVLSALVLVGLYAHLLNWGSYALAIPIVKLQQLTGTLSASGYNELADACLGLAKFECAKNADLDLYRERGDISGLAALAKLEMRLNENQEAMQASAAYFKAGGTSADAAIIYGRLLESTGQNSDAQKYYEAAIANSGVTLPVVATTSLVHLLMKLGKYEDAFARLEAFHASAENAKGYLNTEESQLQSYLSQQAKSGKDRRAKPSAAPKHVARL